MHYTYTEHYCHHDLFLFIPPVQYLMIISKVILILNDKLTVTYIIKNKN